MYATKIVVRLVPSMPSEKAKKEFARWADRHRDLIERLPTDSISVMSIRGEDASTGRIVEKLRHELAMDDALGTLLASDGAGRLEIVLPSDPRILTIWWSTHPTLASLVENEDVSWRDEHSGLPIKFQIDEIDARLLCPEQ